jgi:hypothetical protein
MVNAFLTRSRFHLQNELNVATMGKGYGDEVYDGLTISIVSLLVISGTFDRTRLAQQGQLRLLCRCILQPSHPLVPFHSPQIESQKLHL